MSIVPLIDTHCHLVSYKYQDDEISEIIEKAKNAGVTRMITLGTAPENWESHLKLAQSYPGTIFTCIGIHPGDVHEEDLTASLALLEEKANQGGIVALGETGLDYFHPAPKGWEESAFRQLQQESLEAHFALAKKLGLNLVIHTRDKSGIRSFEDTLAIYKAYADSVRACFHCFIGDEAQAHRVFDLNGIVSFTGITTFGNAKDVLDVARACPAGRFCLETDSPYLAPTPFRGQRNEPAYIKAIADHLAHARHESLDSLATHTNQTAQIFFSLPTPNSPL